MMIRGGITADYKEVKRISDMLVGVIDQGKWVHITTKEGTDIKFSIEGRRGFSLSGYAINPGEFSGLPDGEAACAPLEGTAEGVIVNPYLMEDIGVVKDPISIEFQKGLITKVEGGREAQELLKILEKAGEPGRNVAEFAFGTNSACRITGRSREDKKKLGTAHIAIGDSKSLGGTVDCYMHIDIMFLEPTITVDGNLIVKDGKVIVL
jgi:leucyl aminopeptidase (aminopeptidase T)